MEIGEGEPKEKDIVWAKIKGYPWWPGTIRHIFYYQSQNSYKGIYKRKKYIIDFIGNKSHGEVNKNDIKLFKPNYEEHCKTKNQALIKSIELANKLYQEKFNNNNIEIEEKKEDKETDIINNNDSKITKNLNVLDNSGSFNNPNFTPDNNIIEVANNRVDIIIFVKEIPSTSLLNLVPIKILEKINNALKLKI